MTLSHCPGADMLRGNITITEKKCPECGEMIEIFSCETHAVCDCGFIIYNDVQNCLKWCKYARQCVGDEVYEKFMSGGGR